MVISIILFIIMILGAGWWIYDWIEFENYMSPSNCEARRKEYVQEYIAEYGVAPRDEPDGC